MKNRIAIFRSALSLILILALNIFSFAQKDIPNKPNPPKLYNNLSVEFPDFLSSSVAA
jgi:hypothetical protein